MEYICINHYSYSKYTRKERLRHNTMPWTKFKSSTIIKKSLLIRKGLQNYKSSSNVSSTVSPTSSHDYYVAAFPSSLRLPRVPISAHTKKLVIIVKRKTTQEDKHKQIR